MGAKTALLAFSGGDLAPALLGATRIVRYRLLVRSINRAPTSASNRSSCRRRLSV
jgi:hypothetical protein